MMQKKLRVKEVNINKIEIPKVIPSYASNYPKEFLLITGIDRCFKYYIILIQSQRYSTLDNRLEKINKYLDIYQKKICVPTEIKYDDIKNYIMLNYLLKDIKYRFDFYIGYSETDVDDIDFYYPGLTNLYTTLKRFRSKIILRGRNNAPYEIVDPNISRGF